MRLLLTGGTGQVGRALQALAWPAGTTIEAPGRANLDLAAPASVASYLEGRTFDAILSVGAYTAVDGAQDDVARAWLVNAVAPAQLARAAAQMRAPILHVSTDYVFDGASGVAYVETDAVAPLGVYGASKEGGEQAVRASGARHIILLSSWIIGPTGTNFLRTMLRLGRERPLVRVVADQHGCPTLAADLATAIQALTLRLVADAAAPTGTFHACNPGATTWFALAQDIFRQVTRLGGPDTRLEAIGTSDYPTRARRPRYSVLCTDRLKREYGLELPPWREALPAAVATAMREGSVP
jgi:dTDP-4-dehydrorhamnose reductase